MHANLSEKISIKNSHFNILFNRIFYCGNKAKQTKSKTTSCVGMCTMCQKHLLHRSKEVTSILCTQAEVSLDVCYVQFSIKFSA